MPDEAEQLIASIFHSHRSEAKRSRGLDDGRKIAEAMMRAARERREREREG